MKLPLNPSKAKLVGDHSTYHLAQVLVRSLGKKKYMDEIDLVAPSHRLPWSPDTLKLTEPLRNLLSVTKLEVCDAIAALCVELWLEIKEIRADK